MIPVGRRTLRTAAAAAGGCCFVYIFLFLRCARLRLFLPAAHQPIRGSSPFLQPFTDAREAVFGAARLGVAGLLVTSLIRCTTKGCDHRCTSCRCRSSAPARFCRISAVPLRWTRANTYTWYTPRAIFYVYTHTSLPASLPLGCISLPRAFNYLTSGVFFTQG